MRTPRRLPPFLLILLPFLLMPFARALPPTAPPEDGPEAPSRGSATFAFSALRVAEDAGVAVQRAQVHPPTGDAACAPDAEGDGWRARGHVAVTWSHAAWRGERSHLLFEGHALARVPYAASDASRDACDALLDAARAVAVERASALASGFRSLPPAPTSGGTRIVLAAEAAGLDVSTSAPFAYVATAGVGAWSASGEAWRFEYDGDARVAGNRLCAGCLHASGGAGP